MGISAYVRDKAALADICVCGEVICHCADDFIETIDPDWTDHFLDVWDAIRFYRDGSKPEEWNLTVSQWREECGV
jgi:hypothetical protein